MYYSVIIGAFALAGAHLGVGDQLFGGQQVPQFQFHDDGRPDGRYRGRLFGRGRRGGAETQSHAQEQQNALDLHITNVHRIIDYSDIIVTFESGNHSINHMKIGKFFLVGALLLAVGCANAPKAPKSGPMLAERIDSGFPTAHATFNGMNFASDGKLYYVLTSTRYDEGGHFYRYDPATGSVEFIADIAQALGDLDQKCIAQGKSHVDFEEYDGKLYFATHMGYYQIVDGAELTPTDLPDGWKPYRGGHFVYYDLKTGEIVDLGIAPDKGGIITMTMDKERKHLYGLTWPLGTFLDYDMATGTVKDCGSTFKAGETNPANPGYRVICRSMFVDPRDGNVYWSVGDGDIYSYNPAEGTPKMVEGADLRLDYFGKYDPSKPGSMSYNWRKICWYVPDGKAYGVHGNSGYLFSFDPREKKVEIVDRITSEPSRRGGMFDGFGYGYLSFKIDEHGTVYYLTGAPIFENGKKVEGKKEQFHLVTYSIPEQKYQDLGPVVFPDGSSPTLINSLDVDKDGSVYCIATFREEGHETTDLIRFRPTH